MKCGREKSTCTHWHANIRRVGASDKRWFNGMHLKIFLFNQEQTSLSLDSLILGCQCHTILTNYNVRTNACCAYSVWNFIWVKDEFFQKSVGWGKCCSVLVNRGSSGNELQGWLSSLCVFGTAYWGKCETPIVLGPLINRIKGKYHGLTGTLFAWVRRLVVWR